MNSLKGILAVILLLLPLVPTRSGATPLTPGNERGIFVVESALSQFNALKHHGEALAWRRGPIDPTMNQHYQGLARYPGVGVPVFYVTQRQQDGGGYLHVVRLGSRTQTGERLRSNLQQRGRDTEETYPPASDSWLTKIRFDGSWSVFGTPANPAYEHPGSMALVDDILFVPLDTPVEGREGSTGLIVLFDLSGSHREAPVPIRAIQLSHAIDNLAVTEYDFGVFGTRYLVWTTGAGGTVSKFYMTTGPNLRGLPGAGLELIQTWDPDTDLSGGDWPGGLKGAEAHQSSTFVYEPDGTLFLICMRHKGDISPIPDPFFGSDRAHLYRVNGSPLTRFTLTDIREREFHCVYDGGGWEVDMRIGNFAAANNAYVSPTGELILYSMPHDDEMSVWPWTWDPPIVRLAEFRHRDVNRENSPLRRPVADTGGPYTVNEGTVLSLFGSGVPVRDRPWIELYDDDGFGDRSIVVDYDDRGLLELDDFDHLDGFGDKPSAVRWRFPRGLDVQLWEHHDYEGDKLTLRGSGATESISNLSDVDFNRKASSLRFVGSAPDPTVSMAWDLDGDGILGESGSAASRGDEVGASPQFTTAGLDGPTTFRVRLRVTSSGMTADELADISVVNVAPEIHPISLDGGLEGVAFPAVPVTLTATFQDIPEDTHTATVDWNDGLVAPATVDDADDAVTAEHTYSSSGEFVVSLQVMDDDGGVSTRTALLSVKSPRDGVGLVLDMIDERLESVSNPDAQKALQTARDYLAGNRQGAGRNGAIDKLEDQDLLAALVMTSKALQALEEAEAADGWSLSTEELLLSLGAQSVAQESFNRAAAGLGAEATPQDEETLGLSLSYLEMGIVHVGALEFMAALEAFISSTARSTSLLPDDGVLLTSSSADVQVTWTTRLLQSSPNPFRSRSVIRYELAAPGAVRIRIYDVRGRLLRRISAQHSQPGLYEVEWRGDTDEGRLAPPGVYFCQMSTSGFLATRKMIRIE